MISIARPGRLPPPEDRVFLDRDFDPRDGRHRSIWLRLRDRRDEIAVIRADIASRAKVEAMPPVQITSDAWVGRDPDECIHAGTGAIPVGRAVSLPEEPERSAPNALTPEQLSRFLAAMKADKRYARNFAMTVTLAFTGLRFCHVSALAWEDIDFQAGVIRVVRRQVRGHVGPVSRKKRAPKELPLPSALAEILKEHRRWLVERQNPGLAAGWVFPSLRGKLKTPNTLAKTWQGCLKKIGMTERFTVHGLRRTFNDLTRRAGADGMVTRALTGHVTEGMTAHYSTVGLDEKRAAVAGVVGLPKTGDRTGDGGRN